MQIRFNEHGRSMVEMLGVLAVIGVLSVSGIWGYKFAMNKYIANETINELNIRASAISHHMEQYIENNYAGDIPMEMGPVMRMGYPITARMHPQYVDYFEMFISEVPSEICKLLLQSQWQAPYSIFIGTTQYESSVDICTQAEKVELAYEFHKDLLPEAEIEEKDRHEIMRCRHSNDCNCGTCNVQIGLCETNCLDNEKCVKDYSEPEWMICCRPSNIVGSYCCASVTEDGKCCDWDGNCCPPDKPLRDTDGKCYSCDDPKAITVSRTDICTSMCPKRFINDERYKKCILCGVKGTDVENKPLYNYGGTCYSCDYEKGFAMGIDIPHIWHLCSDLCDGKRKTVGEYCYPACSGDTPLMGTDGKCYSCNDETHTIKIESLTDTCEKLCPNRKTEGEYCKITCSTEKPLQDASGKCWSCDDVSIITVADTSSCSRICPKRFINDERYKKCILCGVEGTDLADKPLYNYGGNCYSCDYEKGFAMGIDIPHIWHLCSDLCDGNRYNIGEYCYPKCPDDTPITGTDGVCQDCNYSGKALSTPCSDVCSNRTIKDGYCVRTECLTGTFADKNGTCQMCNIQSIIETSEDNCKSCLNRSYKDGYCYPPAES